MPWYQDRWWYVEKPFPWIPMLACTVTVALLVFAVVLGIWWY